MQASHGPRDVVSEGHLVKVTLGENLVKVTLGENRIRLYEHLYSIYNVFRDSLDEVI